MRAICYGMGDGLDEVRNGIGSEECGRISGSIKSSANIWKRTLEHHMRLVIPAADDLCRM